MLGDQTRLVRLSDLLIELPTERHLPQISHLVLMVHLLRFILFAIVSWQEQVDKVSPEEESGI